jgi:hypothetical protein
LDNINKTKDSKLIKIEDDLKFLKSEPKLIPTNSKIEEEREETMSDNVFEKLKQEDGHLPKLSKEDELNEIRKRRLNNLNL